MTFGLVIILSTIVSVAGVDGSPGGEPQVPGGRPQQLHRVHATVRRAGAGGE